MALFVELIRFFSYQTTRLQWNICVIEYLVWAFVSLNGIMNFCLIASCGMITKNILTPVCGIVGLLRRQDLVLVGLIVTTRLERDSEIAKVKTRKGENRDSGKVLKHSMTCELMAGCPTAS